MDIILMLIYWTILIYIIDVYIILNNTNIFSSIVIKFLTDKY